MATNTGIGAWDFANYHVQSGISGGKFVGAHCTLIAAGPPKLKLAGLISASGLVGADAAAGLSSLTGRDSTKRADVSVFAWPMGVCENVGIGQNKQITRLFEIGSRRSYFVVGRNIVNLSIARTMYDGPNLLRALYAYYPAQLMPASAGSQVARLLAMDPAKFRQISRAPGFADFFINLDSDLFDHPFGLFLLFLDSLRDVFGACYGEDLHLANHQFGISSSANIIGEGCTIQGDQLLPVNVGAKSFSDQAIGSQLDPYSVEI